MNKISVKLVLSFIAFLAVNLWLIFTVFFWGILIVGPIWFK